MPEPVEQWFDVHTDRVLNRQTSQLETIKLLVTFSLGIAAALVATALQVDPLREVDYAACWVLAVAFLLTIAVILNDTSITMDEQDARETIGPLWSDARKLRLVRRRTRRAVRFNERVVSRSKIWTAVQLTVSLSAAVLAAVSLLLPA